MAGAADGQDPDRWAAQNRVGHRREDRGRVTADHLDERRLEGLVAIGVDEISYRRGQRYLTTVVDHHKGAIVWCAPGRNATTLQRFFELLGDRKQTIRAVSIDMSGGYQQAIRQSIPHADICFDPFHVVRLAQRAVDQVRRDEWNARPIPDTGREVEGHPLVTTEVPHKQTIGQLATLYEVQQANKPLYRAFLSKKGSGCSTTSTIQRSRRASRRLAHLGLPLPARPIHQARAHHPPPLRRNPQRDPPRPQQRPPSAARLKCLVV